ncbi:ABC transporter ATP-binding protein [Variovorax guangxiensis]|uniref:ABC transporter ATP-binding protein n=1 Tax=Variovorax guangxiensis TaxID=1775474 RepID=UPI0019D5C94C|nr:ABC transporter ATP-binding protein [Variovorax guangxiensis]
MASEKSVLLEVEHLAVSYGPLPALHDVNFNVDEGQIVAVLGTNGAGKSTTLKTLVGLMRPNAGSIRYRGEPIGGVATYDLLRRGIALVPEGRRVFAHSTVQENLELGAISRTSNAEIQQSFERIYALFPRLKDRRTQLAGSLSGGEQQMLAIGRAMASKPALLLLDEPSMGLAPIFVNQIFELLVELNEQGTTILVVEQNANLALEIADRAYVLDGGRTVLSGSADEIMNNEAVTAAYLGA